MSIGLAIMATILVGIFTLLDLTFPVNDKPTTWKRKLLTIIFSGLILFTIWRTAL